MISGYELNFNIENDIQKIFDFKAAYKMLPLIINPGRLFCRIFDF